VTDPLDPRFGKDDPDWNGDWVYETRLDRDANRWLALLKIPYKTLGIDPPGKGTSWRGNFGRVHMTAPYRFEYSLWSGATDISDRSSFGELLFEGKERD